MYKIKITYETGNSFGSETATDILELEWNSYDVAIENLKAISEHKKFYDELQNLNTYYNYDEFGQEILKKYENEWWFVEPKKVCIAVHNENKQRSFAIDYSKKTEKELIDKGFTIKWIKNPESCKYLLKLKTDKGKYLQIRAFWFGYFERLLSAEIISDTTRIDFY